MAIPYEEFVQDILISIHENLRDLQERKNFAEAGELDHIEAKIIAYREMLEIIRASADEFGLPKSELGI